MKKLILGASFISLMAFGGTALAASPTSHKTTNQEDCMTMSMKDCMTMMKDCMSKDDCNTMGMEDCMEMMKNMQK
ncbi:hypothetical protein BG07_421 [Bacillus pseudomycoides]|uniref:hypothetical protein n=1 Tax=Bacillus TaxID=1386 RepID=UPI0003676482|nr:MULTISPECIES: hypothetical protein [Bacillus]AIK38742.1 hypothetical protein DJ92_4524 [Bacillus pseudomycoides]AJI14959.1 hypothetical protein BG07_421 [Bacillus pseudomycoides]PEM41234.1 hypothetical protein CN634_03255 [Bacillus pseudomycoides]